MSKGAAALRRPRFDADGPRCDFSKTRLPKSAFDAWFNLAGRATHGPVHLYSRSQAKLASSLGTGRKKRKNFRRQRRARPDSPRIEDLVSLFCVARFLVMPLIPAETDSVLLSGLDLVSLANVTASNIHSQPKILA